MLDQQINEQLSLLQKELSRLKAVTDYIDGAKENSTSIIIELEKVQQNYSDYTSRIFNLYSESVSKIESSTKENLDETKRLLEQYKTIVEATDNLVRTVESVDFPSRLSAIDTNLKIVNKTLSEARQLIDKNAKNYQAIIMTQLGRQHNEIRTLKAILFVICGLIIVGAMATVLLPKLGL